MDKASISCLWWTLLRRDLGKPLDNIDRLFHGKGFNFNKPWRTSTCGGRVLGIKDFNFQPWQTSLAREMLCLLGIKGLNFNPLKTSTCGKLQFWQLRKFFLCRHQLEQRNAPISKLGHLKTLDNIYLRKGNDLISSLVSFKLQRMLCKLQTLVDFSRANKVFNSWL